MIRSFSLVIILLLTGSFYSWADIDFTTTFVLDQKHREKLQALVENNDQVNDLWQALQKRLSNHIKAVPDPAEVINYEGLLDTNPLRIVTTKQLEDMNIIADLLFGWYISDDPNYRFKLKDYINAWATKYVPTGNPINENKLISLIHAYAVLRSDFEPNEQKLIDRWLDQIAQAEMSNERVPMNNWEAKRIKLVHTISIATGEEDLADFAYQHFKDYIDYSLYPDGTSRDLESRDALHYHLSGLDPLLSYGIMVELHGPQNLNVYTYQAEDGASIRKSIDYVVPYALGEKTRQEWINSKVKLDQERANAGLEKYQPGKLFDPKESLDTFTLAWYYNDDYLTVVQKISNQDQDDNSTWDWDRVLVLTLKD